MNLTNVCLKVHEFINDKHFLQFKHYMGKFCNSCFEIRVNFFSRKKTIIEREKSISSIHIWSKKLGIFSPFKNLPISPVP